MAIASVSTITSASPIGWQDAIQRGFERARKTLRNITGLQVVEEKARFIYEDYISILSPKEVSNTSRPNFMKLTV